MNKKEREYLEEVYTDCMSLERIKDLTEYGAAQGDMAAILLDKKRNRLFRGVCDKLLSSTHYLLE